MTYEEALAFIHSRIHVPAHPGLDRMRLLMEKLGHPENRLRFVHIAGSNGKGSTAAMTESILRCAGYRTGLFVSPFVFEFRERIQLDGEPVSRETLCAELARLQPVLEEMKALNEECTEFEVVTALSLLIFLREQVDFVVFEVGIGGLLDCTNVIPAPAAAAITSISLEHTEILGHTVEEIARQKCGILKKGSRAAGYCSLHPDAERVLRETCRDKGVPLETADVSLLSVLEETDEGTRFVYDGREYFVALAGDYQVYNALTVLCIVRQLRAYGAAISDDAVTEGLAHVRFAGRMQVIRRNPLCLIDGAHNPGKVAALCASLDRLYPGRPIVAVMGMMARKDWHASVPQLARRCAAFYAVPAGDPPVAVEPEKLAELARECCPEVHVCKSAREGARLAAENAPENAVIVACGSMYLLDGAKCGFLDRS